MNEIKLQACPFCRSAAELRPHEIGDSLRKYYDIGCTNKTCILYCGTGNSVDTETEIVELWNNRNTDHLSALRGLVEIMRYIVPNDAPRKCDYCGLFPYCHRSDDGTCEDSIAEVKHAIAAAEAALGEVNHG